MEQSEREHLNTEENPEKAQEIQEPVIKEEKEEIKLDPKTLEYENEPKSESIFFCLKKNRPAWKDLPNRKLVVGRIDPQIPNNKISTGKYNVITFLPKNLFEQFSKMANMYFLV